MSDPVPPEGLSYTQAQHLLAQYRAHGESALTPAQHEAVWDCLLAQPASEQVLQALLEEAGGSNALQAELT